MMMPLDTIVKYINELLEIENFDDYCPNGLQIEGKKQIKRIVSGVTACQALINEAIEKKADMLLVHHGFFWKNEPSVLTGMKGRRISSLIKNDINLLAYHLPLDGHVVYGNNAQLGKILELKQCQGYMIEGMPNLLWTGESSSITDFDSFTKFLEQKLNRKALVEKSTDTIKKIAWCTGGAQDYILYALEKGCDTYITGEVSERTIHIARENNINFISAGHHATERYGIKVLGQHIAEKFELSHMFVDIDNPA